MSVLGIDLGNANSVIAVARRGGVDIISNEASNRSTPTLVAFGMKQRLCGESALTQQVSNITGTIGRIKHLLGARWSDPEFQRVLPMLGAYRVLELPDDRVGVEVEYQGTRRVFAPVQLVAMVFVMLRLQTEAATGIRPFDAAISVPAYFSVAQRREIIDAARIAELNPLLTPNDHMAAALSYGLYKTELEENGRLVLIVDVGATACQMSVLTIRGPGAKALAFAYDRNISGDVVDCRLVDYFADLFATQHGVDLRSKPRPYHRLRVACEKLKRVLNANPTAPLHLECIYDELDIDYLVQRPDYEQMLAPVFAGLPDLLSRVLADASVAVADLHSIELVGSGSRLAVFQVALRTALGNRELSFTMNAEESVARGCALHAAILSPAFRVRTYTLHDVQLVPIHICWLVSDPAHEAPVERVVEVFGARSQYPSPKWINFVSLPTVDAFLITVKYRDDAMPPGVIDPVICVVKVAQASIGKADDHCDMRLKIRLNAHGTIDIEAVQLIEKIVEVVVVEEEPKAPEGAVAAEEAATDETTASRDGGEAAASETAAPALDQPQTDATAAADDIVPPPKTAAPPKIKTRYTPVNFEVSWNVGLPAPKIAAYRDEENELLARAREVIQQEEAKNSLESYVYDTLDKLGSTWRAFVEPGEAAKVEKRLREISEWLYQDVTQDQPKKVFEEEMAKVRTVCDPMGARCNEYGLLDVWIPRFEAGLQEIRDRLQSRAGIEHIPEAELAKVSEEVEKNATWFQKVLSQQAKLARHENPALLSSDLERRLNAVQSLAKATFSKPKETPPPVKHQAPGKDAVQPNGDVNAAGEQDTDAPPPEGDGAIPAPEEDTPLVDAVEGCEAQDAACCAAATAVEK